MKEVVYRFVGNKVFHFCLNLQIREDSQIKSKLDLIETGFKGGGMKSLALALLILILFAGICGAVEVKPKWSYKIISGVTSVAISSDGKYVVAGSYGEWDYYNNTWIYPPKVYLFDQSGKLLWSYNTGGDAVEVKPKWSYKITFISGVTSVAISSDGKYVVAGSYGIFDDINGTWICPPKVYFFDQSGKLLWSYKTGGDEVPSVAITPDGKYVVAGSDNGTVYFFDQSGKLLWSYKTNDWVRSVAISSNGKYVVAGSDNSRIYFFDQSGKLLWSYETGWFNSVAITPDGKYVVAGSDNGTVYFFDQSGKLLWSYKTNDWVRSVAISSNGKYVVAGSDNSRIYFFDQSGKLLWSYNTSGEVASVAISSNGKYVVAGDCNGEVYLFDQSGKLLWSYNTGGIVAITPNGKYVVAGDVGGIYFFDHYVFITFAEQTINKAKSMGLSPIKAESLLSQAKQEFSKGNYDKAIELAKQVLELEKVLPEIEKVSSAINKAKSMGLSPIKAESLLSQAKQEFSKGNYNESIKLAKRSYELAIDVDQDGIPNNKDFAPTIPNNYIYFGVSTAIALSSISAYSVKRRRKRRREYEMKKQRLIGEMENILKK